jgi:hypothetical protein
MKWLFLYPVAALSLAWRELVPESSTSGPAPRLGAVLASASGLHALHGGCSSSCCYAPLSDLWVLTAGSTWQNVSTQLNAPSGRLYHGVSAAASPSSAYVYGGTDIQTGCLDELYLLTLGSSAGAGGGGGGEPTAAWAPVLAPQPHPTARSGHSQTALGPGGAFLALGGEDEDGVLGDAWLFQPSGGAAPLSGAWTLVSNFSASGPGPRVQHSALALTLPWGTPALLLAAGTNATGDDTDEVWLLDLGAEPAQWLLLGARPPAAPAAAWPQPRHGHAAWGQQAQPLPLRGGGGSSSSSAQAATLTFSLFGGQSGPVPDPSQFLADAWSFTVNVTAQGGSLALLGGQGVFQQLHSPLAPSARALAGFSTAATGLGVMVGGFAGYNGGLDDRLLNDVWEIVQ